MTSYPFQELSRPARRYLAHTALLTFGLAMSALYFNLLLVELGYDERTAALPIVGELSLLGLLNSLPVLVAALSSLPLWWLVSRTGPRPALIAGAILHAISLLGVALSPAPLPLLASVALSGPAAVLFQVSAAPFMMRHSGADERDLLFSLSAGLNIGVAGLGSLVAGQVPGLAATLLGLPPQGAATYKLTFALAATIAALAALPLLGGQRSNVGTFERLNVGTFERLNVRTLGRLNVRTFQRFNVRTLERFNVRTLERFNVRTFQRFNVRTFQRFNVLRFIVSPLLISFGAALLIPFLNLYFRQRYATSDAALGAIFAAVGITTGSATLLAPLLSRRLGKMGSVVLTQSLAIPCLLLLGAAPTMWVAGLVALVRGALMNMATPLYDAYAMEQTPEPARPVVIGLINGAFSVGYIVGPNISAEVQQRYGFGPLFVATASLYACAALANILIFLRPQAGPRRAIRR